MLSASGGTRSKRWAVRGKEAGRCNVMVTQYFRATCCKKEGNILPKNRVMVDMQDIGSFCIGCVVMQWLNRDGHSRCDILSQNMSFYTSVSEDRIHPFDIMTHRISS